MKKEMKKKLRMKMRGRTLEKQIRMKFPYRISTMNLKNNP
jgi:hypothetical protein